MFFKALLVLVVSSLPLSAAYSGNLADVADAAKSLGSTSGNVALSINAEKGNVDIKANATGADSSANAGMAVIDSTGGGKTVNIVGAYNAGTAKIEAIANGGGNANAGMSVVRSK